MSEEKSQKLELRIEKCFSLFDQSFNRVKYFSAVTENITRDAFPDDWIIKKKGGFGYGMKPPTTDKEQANLLVGYKHFMQCYLVRDCIESFALCLDQLFLALLLHNKRIRSSSTLRGALSKEEDVLFKGFEKAGLSGKNGKIQQLKSHFNFSLTKENSQIVTSLKDIRNCFSHGNGFARNVDGKKDGRDKRKFQWKAFTIFGVDNDGNEFDLKCDGEQVVKGGSTIYGKIQENVKSVKINTQLTFTPAESYEIAWSLHLVAKEYFREIAQKGINRKATNSILKNMTYKLYKAMRLG